jgi:formamidopyrimidine-DNA glycosylase
MPELPEVENVRRGLEPHLRGHRILRVEMRRCDLRCPFPERFAGRLEGAKVVRLERRAKYLVAHLSTGEALIMHLGMTGRFTVRVKGGKQDLELGDFEYETASDAKHEHVVFHLSGGERVSYSDPRRFGYMLLEPEGQLGQHPLFRSLGVEPLRPELTPAYLAKRAAGRRSNLKAFLMDQRIIAGLGNIYVCEALFRAGLAPSRKTSTLAKRSGAPSAHAERLVAAIRAVLKDAIAAGGSTLRDYRRADGSEGGFQHRFSVYGREGEPCVRPGCRGIVRRSIHSGRSTFHCSVCQR